MENGLKCFNYNVFKQVSSKYLPVQSNNLGTRIKFRICSKLTMKTPDPDVFIVNFEYV